MLFVSFFKTLIDCEIEIELKNNSRVRGKLAGVDTYMNLTLKSAAMNMVEDGHEEWQTIKLLKTLIRGSSIRYVHMTMENVDTALLQDATRRESRFKAMAAITIPREGLKKAVPVVRAEPVGEESVDSEDSNSETGGVTLDGF
ncbi:U6 snRNA-associated Sm-like protein LSm2 [Rhizina undulata]